MTVSLISAFEVPPGSDEAFLEAWRRARDFPAGSAPTTLHRAIRPDAEFRFVNVARVDSPDAVAHSAFHAVPFAAHPGLYEVVHEDGRPDGADGVILVNLLAVPATDDERFLTGWRSIRDRLAPRRGYMGTRLHRSLGAADFRFVDVARWSSPLTFAQALQQPDAQDAAAALPFPSHPALYQVVGD